MFEGLQIITDAQILQLLGIVYLAVGIGVLLNPQFYKKLLDDYSENLAVVYLGGLIALAIGYLLTTFHNIWVKDWPVIITLIGWIALAKGLLILVLPKICLRITRALKKQKRYLVAQAILVAGLGAFLGYLGYFVVQ
jgi:hypothetical protein